MFALIAKLFIPVASATAVYIPTKTVTPVSAFQGTYNQVNGDCGAQSITINLDGSSNSLIMSSASGETLLILSSIDQGRQSLQDGGSSDSKSNGYGTIQNISTSRRSFDSTITTAVLKDGNLKIVKHIQQGFSRAKGPADIVCELQK